MIFSPSTEKKEFFEAISNFFKTLQTQRQTSLNCGMDLTPFKGSWPHETWQSYLQLITELKFNMEN